MSILISFDSFAITYPIQSAKFQILFFIEFFDKHFAFRILHKLAKVHYQVVFRSKVQ